MLHRRRYSRPADGRENSPAATGPTDRTAIGVDLGEHTLYTACPVPTPNWTGTYAIPGDELCARLDALRDRVAALLAGDADRETIVARVRRRRTALLEVLERSALRAADLAKFRSAQARTTDCLPSDSGTVASTI